MKGTNPIEIRKRELDTLEGSRISWDEAFMAQALIARLRTTCIKRGVGANLVKGRRSIASGYNGAPRGVPHCTQETCTRLDKHSLEESADCRGVHAEINCLIQAALYGVPCGESSIYVTRFPCMSCTKALINAEIVEIIYLEESDMDNSIKMAMLQDAGVIIRQIELTPFLAQVISVTNE